MPIQRVLAAASAAASLLSTAPGTVLRLVTPSRDRPRRCWIGNGRAHVEVRGIDRPGTAGLAAQLERRLVALPGVISAETNALLGRVVIGFDPGLSEVDDLVATVEEVEAEHGSKDAPFVGPDHPGDREPALREAVIIGADLTGVGLSVAGRLLRAWPAPVAVPVLVSLADTTGRVRPGLERRIGRDATDLVFGLSGAAAGGLAQRPTGLLVDAAYRLPRLGETRARRRTFEARELELGGPGTHRVAPFDRTPRRAPLPTGPVEHLTDHATARAAAAYAVVLAFTRSHARAQGFLAAGIPKAARIGREAFASQVGRAAANRGAVTLDPQFLRRLDRVDTVVLDASALLTGRQVLEDVVPLAGNGAAADSLYRRAHRLVDPGRPDRESASDDGWAVAPFASVVDSDPDRYDTLHRAMESRRHGATLLALTHQGRPQALVTVVPELDPLAEALVTAARRVGSVLVAGKHSRLQDRLRVDGGVPGGSRLRSSVEALQERGHGVVLVSARGGAALAAADVGVGLVGRGEATPWSADVLCGPELAEAWRLLEAVAVARRVSARASKLAVTGSVAGVLLSLAGPPAGAAGRALTAVDVAAAVAVADGTWNAVSLSRRPAPVPVDRTRWHAMDPEAVLYVLDSSTAGLSEQDAARRLGTDGQTGDAGRVGIATASLRELDNPLTAALGAGAGISAAVGSVFDAALIGSVLGVNAVIGGAQRLASDRSLRRLSSAAAIPLRLRRGGIERETTSDQLVPGDVITVAAGDVVPADCRLLDASGLEVDEAGLTGESQLVVKTRGATAASAVADRHSMLYEGTVVAAGNGTAIVVATGPRTETGRATRLGVGEAPRSGVEERLHGIGRVTVPASLAAGAALLGGELLQGRPFGQALGQAVGLAVAAVPEALPFVATVAELAAARRLSKRAALIRNPATIEALGRVDVLCFDKTGTLTEGRIALRLVSDGRTRWTVDSASRGSQAVIAGAVRAGPPTANHARLPHPTDRAVIQGAETAGVTTTHGVGEWRRVAEMRFEPGRGYHAVLGHSESGHRLSVNGAPEVVLARCARWRRNGSVVPLGAAARRQINEEVDQLARLGYRVLAVAERPASDRADLAAARVRDLEFLGLLGLADPVRPTATRAVEQLRQAGLDVVMITGDHPSTAESIAAELDALNGRAVVTGPELDQLDDEGLAAVLSKTAVFARVSPAQKARIVKAFQRAGRVVAVTGDGANDAAAIRLADVGVAIGRRATPAARGAADVVVTDDRIETIADAIVEGRAMWASVRDALSLLLGGNLGEIAFTLATGLAGSQGLNARQLLLVNLLTDMLPAMAIAVRPPPGITPEVLLAEGPEVSLGSALSRDILVRAGTTAAASYAAWSVARLTGSRARAGTVGLIALVDAQLLQTMLAGNRSPVVLAAGAASLGALAFVVQTPGVSQFFGCRPLGPAGWAIGLGSASAATLTSAALQAVLSRRDPTH